MQPRPVKMAASSGSETPSLYPSLRPSTTTNTRWFASITPIPVRGWSPWMEWLPTFVSISTSSIPSTTAPACTMAGPNDSVFQTPAATSASALAAVAVDDAVADDDAGLAEAVVVAVDGEDGVVVRGDVGGVLDDVRAELVVRERRAQHRRVGEHHVGDVVGDRAVAAAGDHGGDVDRAVLRGVRGVGESPVRARGV